MTELIDFNGKVKHQLRESTLDFVVPLPLLECISRLEQADKTLPMRCYIYYDDAKRASLKKVTFIIGVVNPQLMTRVKGTIQQQEENFSRFTGTAEFVNEIDKSIKIRLVISSICAAFILYATLDKTPDYRMLFVPLFFSTLLVYLILLLVLDSRNTAIKMQQLTEAIQRQLLFE